MVASKKTINYLKKIYRMMSVDSQKKKLNEIIDRLDKYEWGNKELLHKSAKALLSDGWELEEVLVFFDVMDLDERT